LKRNGGSDQKKRPLGKVMGGPLWEGEGIQARINDHSIAGEETVSDKGNAEKNQWGKALREVIKVRKRAAGGNKGRGGLCGSETQLSTYINPSLVEIIGVGSTSFEKFFGPISGRKIKKISCSLTDGCVTFKERGPRLENKPLNRSANLKLQRVGRGVRLERFSG